MNSNKLIKNPSITVYAFHLRNDLEYADQARPDASLLWDDLRKSSIPLAIPELDNLPNYLVCYQNGKYTPSLEESGSGDYINLVRSTSQGCIHFSNNEIELSIYPLKLHDTYAVDATLYFKDGNIDSTQLERLNANGYLLFKSLHPSIGQTVLLYGEPTSDDLESLSKKYVELFWKYSSTVPTLMNKGTLFGKTFFEYSFIEKHSPSHELQHTIVWFGEDDPAFKKKLETINVYFINLLCCRHKILFSYHQANQSNLLARKLYSKVEPIVHLGQTESKKERLSELEKVLSKIPPYAFEYSSHLRNLMDHKNTIQHNSYNFVEFAQRILSLADKNDKMLSWDTFRTKSIHYENQVQAYISYLEAGQRLLQQLIDRAQGIISVDSLQHSHRLELVVVSVASMLEATAISAKVNHHLTDLIHYEVHGVMGHYINIALHFFAVGLPLGIFAGLVIFLLQKYRH